MSIEWQVCFKNLNHKKFYRNIYAASIACKLPVALWRNPSEKEIHTVVDLSGRHSISGFDHQTMSPGFIFAPFNSEQNQSVFLINADIYWQGSVCFRCLHESNNGKEQRNFNLFSKEIDKLNRLESPFLSQAGHEWYNPKIFPDKRWNVSKREYLQWTNTAVKAIRQERLRKVVLSRALTVELKESFNALQLFERLCATYPRAFVSFVALPGVGTWLGATPELLLKVQPDELSTVALAGTTVAGQDKTYPWSSKEIVEQEIVSEYIRDCFHRLDCGDFIERGPETVQIGRLLHLKTFFRVQRKNLEPGCVTKLVQELHPTPAVCGVPKEEALKFIAQHEIHEREYYAGYLGTVNIQNDTRLFVNLRCMQLLKDTAVLYAGGGITIDSDAENEWQETELKFDALLSLLRENKSSLCEASESKTRAFAKDKVSLG